MSRPYPEPPDNLPVGSFSPIHPHAPVEGEGAFDVQTGTVRHVEEILRRDGFSPLSEEAVREVVLNLLSALDAIVRGNRR